MPLRSILEARARERCDEGKISSPTSVPSIFSFMVHIQCEKSGIYSTNGIDRRSKFLENYTVELKVPSGTERFK